MTDLERSVANIRRWKVEPWTFVREVFGVVPDAWQDEVLHAVVVNQRLALKACKGPGKSTVMAWLLWWFLSTRLHPKVVATSVTGDNLRDGLWTEAAKWQNRSEFLKQAFTWQAERIVCDDHSETWWASARTWPKQADPTQQADTLAGIHADNVLFLIDEAGGVPDAVVATAEAALANADPARGTEAILVIGGNPSLLSGPLYRACTKDRALWWVKEISSAPDDPNRTPRVSVQWAQQQIDTHGRENPWVLINVFGQFPPGQSNALLGVEEVGAATKRFLHDSVYRDEVKILGVDVARFGDDQTVCLLRQGPVAYKPKAFRSLDLMQVVGQVSRIIGEHKPDAVFVDGTGLGGGVVDRLNQLGYGVVEVNNGSAALEPGAFSNRRAECWWKMAQWVKAGGCIPDDPELVAQLTAPTYWYDAQNKLRLESKDDLKERGLPSPDQADALALTFAAPVAPKALREMSGPAARAVHDYDPFARGRA